MHNEQNVDDVLKLLMENIDNPTEAPYDPKSETPAKKMSEEELRDALKEQFANGEVFGKPSGAKSPYDLDSSMLEEFSAEAFEEEAADVGDEAVPVIDEEALEEELLTVEDHEETELVSEEESFEEPELVEEEEAFEEPELVEEEEAFEEAELADEIEADDIDLAMDTDEEAVSEEDTYFELGEDSEITEEIEELMELVADNDDESEETSEFAESIERAAREFGTIPEPVEVDEELEEDIVIPAENDEIIASEEDIDTESTFDEFTDYPKYKPISFKTLIMDYGNPDPTPEADEAPVELGPTVLTEEETPDVGDILSDFADNAPTHEEHVNDTMRELMAKLGCEDELDSVSPEDLGEIYAEYEGEEEAWDEKSSAERKKRRREEYQKNTLKAAIRTVGCAVLTLAILLYDLLPVFGVEFFWLSDYNSYPGAYVLIGTQLLLFCAICLWKPLLDGIKKLATPYPNMYSLAAILVAFNFGYDIIFLISGNYEPLRTPMFHFLSATVVFSLSLMELITEWREAGAFDLYSTDVAKFTLCTECGAHSVSAKMYGGGFSKDKQIYTPTPVSRAKGFTKAIREEASFNNGFFSALLYVASVVSVLFAIVMLILGRTVDEAAVAMMMSLYALLPVGAITAVTFEMFFIAVFLTKRGIALTGRKKIKKYAKASALVFGDLNLFERCSPKEVGFVCYEKSQTNAVLAALQILYSRIGGPMSQVFSNVPDSIKAKKIRVRRITKSGVEAIIDRSHVLLVGDLEFMRRYGMIFSEEESDRRNGRNAILYISYDGKASAKISAKYRVDPFFDMLIERLAAEGGHCVIETYDPVINTNFVARLRREGHAPISVVHKNAADINSSAEERPRRRSDNGILTVSSRLKLTEAVVWCSRLGKIDDFSTVIIGVSMAISLIFAVLFAVIGVTNCIIPAIMLAISAITSMALLAVAIIFVPRSGYFTVEGLRKEEQNRETKNK